MKVSERRWALLYANISTDTLLFHSVFRSLSHIEIFIWKLVYWYLFSVAVNFVWSKNVCQHRWLLRILVFFFLLLFECHSDYRKHMPICAHVPRSNQPSMQMSNSSMLKRTHSRKCIHFFFVAVFVSHTFVSMFSIMQPFIFITVSPISSISIHHGFCFVAFSPILRSMLLRLENKYEWNVVRDVQCVECVWLSLFASLNVFCQKVECKKTKQKKNRWIRSKSDLNIEIEILIIEHS